MTLDPFAGRPRTGPPKQWSIATYGGASWRDLRPLRAPSLTAREVTDIDAAFVADPFLDRDGDTWRLFFEVKNSTSGRGEIAAAHSTDAIAWHSDGVILAEPFHLSYPHVVRADGEVWMTPESIEAGAVLLYRATGYPLRWSLHARLLEGAYADPTPFFHGGLWWMFACPRPMKHDALSLFVAERITGPWREHPRSPLVTNDASRCRPAGPVRMFEDLPVRFAQDCVPAYGTGVRAFAITKLTLDDFEEREIKGMTVPRASGIGWNRDGSHHLDVHRDGDRWIAVTDGYTLVPEEPPAIAVEDPAKIADEWDAMFDVCDAHPVFSSPAWFLAAARNPRVYVARRQGRITGILPLVARDDGALGFATPLSDYNDVIAFDDDTAARLLRAVDAPLSLRGIRPGSKLDRALPSPPELETHCSRASLPFGRHGRVFRKSLLRAVRAAAREGFAVTLLRDGVAEHLLALHAARFGARGRLTAHAAMLRAALPPLVAAGRVRAYALVREGEVFAIDVTFVDRHTIASWNGGFRSEVAHLSPGSLLFAREIADAEAEGRTTFDMLRGMHAYKQRWANESVPLYRYAST
ncbi:MAG TPA: GNAT family N-acetyltransferase [Thermoanaerobaculia bacterium]|nr:GNAT family N-acetyltransferase [Thermoanaerobaculia bacterium]